MFCLNISITLVKKKKKKVSESHEKSLEIDSVRMLS